MVPGPARPDLSVIIVTHDRPELALRTISSARAATGGIDVRWHVVDSGSSEPVADMIKARWPDIEVQRAANVGFAAANNRALRHANGRYVLLLNPDVEVAHGTFAELLSTLDGRPRVGMASVIQRAPDGSLQRSIRRDPSPSRALAEALAPGRIARMLGVGEIEARPEAYRRESPADWLCGAFLIARAEAVQQIGPLDERFLMYSEETDWCYRCRRAGWQIRHLPVMVVTHHTGGSYSAARLAQLSRSRLLFAQKHLDRAQARALRRGLALGHLVRFAALTGAGPLLGPRARTRARAELHALTVVLGRRSVRRGGLGLSGRDPDGRDGRRDAARERDHRSGARASRCGDGPPARCA